MTDGADDAGELPPGTAAYIREYLERHGFLSWLGTELEEIEMGHLVMTIPFEETLTNVGPDVSNGRPSHLHGGVAATLIDTAGGVALRPFLDDPLEGGIATINLNVNYLRAATGDLRAEAEVIRAGGSIGVVAITVESETPDGEVKPVATGQGAYRLFRT